MMKQDKALNVTIVGGGPGCKAIMDMIFAEKLSQLRMKLIGVACTDPKAVGYCYAQEKGIYTTNDYRDLYKLKDLNMIIELTGREGAANEISRTKPEHVRLMDHVAARLFWDIFQIEEQRIAERESGRDALRESEEKYSILVENSLTGIYVDLDGKIVLANSKFAEIYGYSRDELIGTESRMLVHPEDRALTNGMRTRRLKGEGAPLEYEARGLRKDGEIIWIVRRNTRIEYKGRPAILGNIVDITERKRAKAAVRESEERYRTLFDLSPQAIALTDVSTGKLIDVNDQFCEATKYSREEVLGRTTTECGFYSQQARDTFLKQLQELGQVHGFEMDFRAKDGSILSTLMFAKLVRIAGESFILTIFLDVTGRKRLEAQLREAQKMEAIGTLAGGIAHDFNNLLMGIQGNSSLMLLDVDSSHPHHGRLKRIERQVRSGVKLTRQLLGYARKGKYEVKPIDLNPLVEETSETFARTKKDITIHRDLAEDLRTVEADKGQIEQVLLNLYVNAADAMPDGGELILKTTNITHEDMKGTLHNPKPGNYLLLTVTDTGTGMDRETMERIFEPFFTTKEMGRGTGLGLASAYGIIRGHGGHIDVESKKGESTTFSIYLPASEKKATKALRTADRFTKGAGTVLLVDDEVAILEVGQELLGAMGYRVLVAKGGQEAIEVYKKRHNEIDLVLLDMVMPKICGGEVYDRMKEINPDVKVLLSSGYSIDGQATDILKRGCNGFIQKPFSMRQLSQSLKKILDKE